MLGLRLPSVIVLGLLLHRGCHGYVLAVRAALIQIQATAREVKRSGAC